MIRDAWKGLSCLELESQRKWRMLIQFSLGARYYIQWFAEFMSFNAYLSPNTIFFQYWGFTLARALHLLGRLSTAWVMPLTFSFGYFIDRVSFFAQAGWTMILLFYASHQSWGDRCAPPCLAFLHWDGGLTNFLSRLAWNRDLPNQSQLPKIASITGVYPTPKVVIFILILMITKWLRE
jgi:hypothetical protein